MFKNIELSEINSDSVVGSLWILLLGTFVFALFTIGFSFATDGAVFDLEVMIYFVIQLVFLASPLWGGGLFIFYLIERFTLGKRSTTKTVRILFIIEMVFPLVLLVISVFSEKFDSFTVFMTIGIIATQCIRWIYLKSKNRMYHFIN